MPSKTTNYGLIKPNKDEFYDVQVQNGNMDIIDQQLKINADNLASTNRTLTERIIEVENQLSSEPPVESTLVSGEQTLTTEHDGAARVKVFKGDTIVNYVPLFDSGLLLSKNATSIIEAPNKFRAISANAFGYCGGFKIPLKPNTTYMLIMDIEAIKGNDYFFIRSNEDNTNLLSGSYQGYGSDGVQFTTKADTSYIHFIFSLNANDSEIVYSNVRIVECTEPKPFVANVQGITNPTIENTTTGDSITLLGTFHKGDVVSEDKGQYSVLRAKKEIVLDGFLAWVLYNQQNGFKTIRLPFTRNQIVLTEKVVKYNGAILSQGFDKSSDQSWLDETNLFITVSNTDSGWGDLYTPTADEIKAYFLGWTMRDTSGALYNRTDGLYKRWHPLVDKDMAYWSPTSLTTTVDRVPTIQAHRTLPNVPYVWQPNKLVYDLANPVKEQVQAINSVLQLAKGDNALQVSEGRIVREVAKPVIAYGAATINYKTSSYDSSLSVKVTDFLNVYKNGEIDTTWNKVVSTSGYGGVYLDNKTDFDPTAVYTVDYEPLYPFELTAPINNVTIEYLSNLSSVVNQNVEDIVELKKDVAVIEHDMVRKGEGAEWLNFTVIGGWTGSVRARKFNNGIIELFVELINVGTTANNTVICKLPSEFSPAQDYVIPMFKGNTSPYDFIAPLKVIGWGNGEIRLVGGFPIPTGTTGVNIRGSILMMPYQM